MKYTTQIGLVFCLIFSLTLMAQDCKTPPIHSGQNKISSEKILLEKLKYYQTLKGFSVKFNQIKRLKSLQIEITSKGEMTLRSPDFLSWKITSPSEMEVILENSRLTMKSKNIEGKDSTQSFSIKELLSSEANQNIIHLTKWLQMDASFIIQHYQVQEKSKNIYFFEAKIKDQSPFQSLLVKILPSGELSELTINEKNSDELLLKFDKPVVFR